MGRYSAASGRIITLEYQKYLEGLGVERSRTAIHDWVQKTDLQPASAATPNQIALDETVIRVNDERHWLYAAVDPDTNDILHVRLFHTRTTQLTGLFLRELREQQQVADAAFLVDNAHYDTLWAGYPPDRSWKQL